MRGRVFVIGLGLIGGSLALCIKREHGDCQITGYDIYKEQGKIAKMLGVVDELVDSIEEGAKNADLILITTPVVETERILDLLYEIPLKDKVLITDAGSTKAEIVKKAEKLATKGITFIGGHPMAGSHKSGVSAARAILFENAFYLLTPDKNVKEEKLIQLKEWLKGTKAKFLVVSPYDHDLLTGVISHFPHIIAASLVHQAKKTSNEQSLVPRLAAGGFKDITRIASSSPGMWRDILLHNKEVLLEQLKQWQLEMQTVVSLLQSEDGDKIYQYFEEAKRFRDELPQQQKGAIPAFYDLFVDVPDYPGVVSEVTGYLAKEEISITNIQIRETREDIIGVLVISFQTEEDRTRAKKCIEHYTNFETSVGP
ncbi:prephenate dehydrogenase [Niallia sp. Krafla_26]|uniref:prephenate dehydrogenase n=1 Tax=Niallia sp. Krafla_26 TaxID=3064703 RepID=UPI003D181848